MAEAENCSGIQTPKKRSANMPIPAITNGFKKSRQIILSSGSISLIPTILDSVAIFDFDRPKFNRKNCKALFWVVHK